MFSGCDELPVPYNRGAPVVNDDTNDAAANGSKVCCTCVLVSTGPLLEKLRHFCDALIPRLGPLAVFTPAC